MAVQEEIGGEAVWRFQRKGVVLDTFLRVCPEGHFQERLGFRPWSPCTGCFAGRQAQNPLVVDCARLDGEAYRAEAARLRRLDLGARPVQESRRAETEALARSQNFELLQLSRNVNNHSILILRCTEGHLLRRYQYRESWLAPCSFKGCRAPVPRPHVPRIKRGRGLGAAQWKAAAAAAPAAGGALLPAGGAPAAPPLGAPRPEKKRGRKASRPRGRKAVREASAVSSVGSGSTASDVAAGPPAGPAPAQAPLAAPAAIAGPVQAPPAAIAGPAQAPPAAPAEVAEPFDPFEHDWLTLAAWWASAPPPS